MNRSTQDTRQVAQFIGPIAGASIRRIILSICSDYGNIYSLINSPKRKAEYYNARLEVAVQDDLCVFVVATEPHQHSAAEADGLYDEVFVAVRRNSRHGIYSAIPPLLNKFVNELTQRANQEAALTGSDRHSIVCPAS